MTTQVHFLPWVRSGLASLAHDVGASDGVLQFAPVVVGRADAYDDQATDDTRTLPTQAFQIQGPGAVVGLRASQIIRQDPKPNATEVEPNYFASVELASADLPWRYTLGGPDTQGRLTPWLALVVVQDRAGIELSAEQAGRTGRLVVDDPRRELPPLADAWSWAHVQYQGDDPSDPDVLQSALVSGSSDLRARLICPRRLEPGLRYNACLVPVFEAGRLSGLGSPGSDDLSPAWDYGSGPFTLPVYASWGFQTGLSGDFESLAKRLSPRVMSGSVGLRDVHVAGDMTQTHSRRDDFRVPYAGALVSPLAAQIFAKRNADPSSAEADLRAELVDRLNEAAIPTVNEDPVVALPMYGAAYRDATKISLDEGDWLAELNSQPSHRIVAGLAAEIVRANQEELVDVAWDSIADAQAANVQVNATQLASEVGRVAQTRWDAADVSRRTQVSAPSFHAIRASNSKRTLHAQIAGSAIPNGLLSGAARRIMRPRSGLGAALVGPNAGALAVSAFMTRPAGEISAYRAALPPLGQNPQNTQAPALETLSNGRSVLMLSRPAKQTRDRVDFTSDSETGGIFDRVKSAQNSAALLARSLKTRISGLPDITPDTLPRRVATMPRFVAPAFQKLRDHALTHLVPGADEIPNDTATLMLSNATFVRSYMVGLNHEIAREFLWRELPTPPDATWFQHFWSHARPDIAPIKDWGQVPLAPEGKHPTALDDSLVLLIRGALPNRYPDLRIYAVQAVWDDFQNLDDETVDYRKIAEGAKVVPPSFAGQLSDDMFFIGLPLSVATARGSVPRGDAASAGYFFVLEEPPSAPRFGLEHSDPADEFGSTPHNWKTVSWANVTAAGDPALAPFLTQGAAEWMTSDTVRDTNGPAPDGWAEDAAAFARQTLQRPARVLIHASAMLPNTGGS